MPLTRDFKQTIAERAFRDPAFAEALRDEAARLFLHGEPDAAQTLLVLNNGCTSRTESDRVP